MGKKLTQLTINPTLDSDKQAALKAEFADCGIVRIFDFLNTEGAEELSRCLHHGTSFNNAFFLNHQNREASDEQIAQLPNAQRREMYQAIYQLAAQGQGFLYGRHKASDSSPAIIDEALKMINDEACLSVIKHITGDDELSHADGQATRYRVGDFLTRHIDNLPGETRKYAYVLGLSPNWHPDWGGLLQMFEPDGTPTQSYMPIYNSLTLFDVNKVHSVTSIAPFSPASRYSLTGWFRS
ncbi:proline hydroxylase [Thalassotalea euphylliae]|uniref:Proline hydroxylase n=1 Tax=Thalassotalea euphylliae TaxID=1655234 RepID=A0A3E0U8C8_9GAMM|nr:proline hydroxylase [Thalassotalea euphylliae]